MKSYNIYTDKIFKKHKFLYVIIAVMSICITVGVFFALERPGIAMTVDGKIIIEDTAEIVASGTSTTNIKWTIYDGEDGYILCIEPNDSSKTASVSTRLISMETVKDYYSQITAIKVCDGITSIPANFAMPSSGVNTVLTIVDLSECSTLRIIGTNSFYNCNALFNVSLPEGVTSIGNTSFYNCGFEEFPFDKLSNVASMGTQVFNACKKLKSADMSNISSVTYIPDSTFVNCTSLESVSISESVTKIGASAFNGCVALKQINIPDDNKITTIGNQAFYKAGIIEFPFDKLTELTSIGFGAFNLCPNLEIVDLSNSTKLNTIGYNCFRESPSIKKVLFADENEITRLENYTFYKCTGLEEVQFEKLKLEGLGIQLAEGCSKLKKADLSKSAKLTSIPSRTFFGCSSLSEVILPEENQIESIGGEAFRGTAIEAFDFEYLSKVTSFGSNCFTACKKLKEADLSKITLITEIPTQMFYDCISLKNVELPENNEITSIGGAAFRNTIISEFDFEKLGNVETMGDGVFYGCSQLKTADMSKMTKLTKIPKATFRECKALKKVTLPESELLTMIDEVAFYSCTALTDVAVPEGNKIQSIEKQAFQACTSLRTFAFEHLSELESVGNNSFYQCSSLRNVMFPENNKLKSIGSQAFQYCSAITDISFENFTNLETIGYNAFANCTTLKKADMSNMNKLNAIPSSMFANDTALSEVIFPDDGAITSIGASAFSQCTSLTALDVSKLKTLTIVNGGNTFYNTKIQTLDFSGTKLTKINGNVFNYMNSLKSVSFKECVNLQEITADAFANSNNAALQVTKIDFSGCTSLTAIPEDFGKTLKRLETVNLTGCTALEVIDDRAFSGCTVLEEMEGMETCTALSDIGEEAFKNCSVLENIILNSSLKTIGEGAFNNCSGLTGIDYNDANISEIGEDAFTDVGKKNGVIVNVSKDTSEVSANLFIDNIKIKEVLFEGENTNLILGKNALQAVGNPLSAMSDGITEYYVDESGVVYSKDLTVLYYIPPHIVEYNVPGTVVEVASNICREADDLKTLIFEDISNVTKLKTEAFAECGTLTTIRSGKVDATTVEAAEQLFENADIGANVFRNTGLLGGTNGTLTSDILVNRTYTDDNSEEYELKTFFRSDTEGKLINEINPSSKRVPNIENPNEDIYYYLTNEIAKISINLSAKGATESKLCRVYFQSSSDSIVYDFKEGINSISSEDGADNIECNFVRVSGTNISYLEFEAKAGETFGFVTSVYYPNFSETEGSVKVWSEIVKDKDSALKLTPEEYQKGVWYTAAQEWSVTKGGAGTLQALKSVRENDEIVKRFYGDFGFYIYSKSTYGQNSDTNDTYGVDPVKALKYEDTLQLPEGIYWEDKVVEAVKNGEYGYSSTGTIYVIVDGKQLTVASIDKTIAKAELTYDEETKMITIAWKINNSKFNSSTATNNKWEMDDVSPRIIFNADEIFKITEEYDVTSKHVIENTVKQTAEYLYAEEGLTKEHTKTFFEKQYTSKNSTIPKSDIPRVNVAKTLYNHRTDSTSNNVYGGNKVDFNIRVYNDGLVSGEENTVTDVLQLDFQIAPEDMERMFAESYGAELLITIEKGYLQPMKETTAISMTGQTVELSPINKGEPLKDDDKTEDFNISWSKENNCIWVVHGEDSYLVGEGREYSTLKELWNELGFLNRWNTKYTCIWTCENTKIVPAESRQYVIYATAKTTFEKIQLDRIGDAYEGTKDNENIGKNTASIVVQGNQTKSATTIGNISWYRELMIDKSYAINGKLVSENEEPKIAMGSELTFNIAVRKYAYVQSDVISLNDEMSGAMAALALVEENEDAILVTEQGEVKLSDADMDKRVNRNGELCYVLSKEGTYRNLRIGSNDYGEIVLADKVIVSKGNQISTHFYWYYDSTDMSFSDKITYDAITDESFGGQNENGEFSISNIGYLNDRENDRLYDGIHGSIRVLASDKNIVIENPAQPDEKTAKDKVVAKGESVIYKLTVENLDEKVDKKVKILFDILPSTYGQFEWTKENVSIEAISNLGTKNTTAQNWRISKTATDGTEEEGIYYIYWNNNEDTTEPEIVLRAGEKLDLYVTVKYPDNTGGKTTWDDYEKKVIADGNRIHNRFVANGDLSTVSNTLKVTGEALLQKGVYGVYEHGAECNDRNTYTYTGFGTSYVSYYITVYNSGEGRLYLNPIKDILPEGFTYKSMTAVSTIGDATSSGNNFDITGKQYWKANFRNTLGVGSGHTLNVLTYGYPNSDNTHNTDNLLATVSDIGLGTKEVEYVSAYVHTDRSGRNLTFTVSNQYGSDSTTKQYTSIGYDEELKMCYLDKGQALVFGYIADIGMNDVTDEIATNNVAMQYYDYNGAGCRLPDNEQVFVQGNYTKSTDARNDGIYDLLPSNEALELGFSGDGYSDWLSSDVTVRRTGKVIPGVKKNIIGRIQTNGVSADVLEGGLCESGDTQIWQMNFINDGTESVSTYTVTDTIQAPYYFDGNITYRMCGDSYADVWSKGGFMRGESKTFNYENDTLLKNVTFKDEEGSGVTKALSDYNKDEITVEFRTESGTKNGNSITWSDNVYSAKLGVVTEVEFSWCDVTLTMQNAKVKVLFDLDEEGNCVLKLTFDETETKGFGFISPHGGYAMMTARTKKPDNVTVYSTIENKVEFEPKQTFDPQEIQSGTVTRDEENNPKGVVASSSFTVKGAYSTTSWKTITDNSEPENTASSKDIQNYITLLYDEEKEEHCSDFTYALNVKNLCDNDKIEKMVIIDNLPEQGDHMAYGSEQSNRDSEFVVILKEIEDNAIYVKNTDNEGVEAILGRNEESGVLGYTIEFSTETTFDDHDWSGEYVEKWISIEETTQMISDGALSIEDIRSFRVIVGGGDGIPVGNTITVSLNAKILGDVKREQTAWNNFGYKYYINAKGTEITMSASSLVVGVKTATIPKIKKNITAGTGMEVFAEELGIQSEFIAYEGEQIEYSDKQDLLKKLYEADKEFTVLTISGKDIDEGNWVNFNEVNISKSVKNASGKYEINETDDKWKWVEGTNYNITESDMSEHMLFSMMQNVQTNNYSFTYERNGKYTITCDNIYNDYNLQLTKTDRTSGETLKDAVFARYQLITGKPDDDVYQEKVQAAWKSYVDTYIEAVEMMDSLDKARFLQGYVSSERLKAAKEDYDSFTGIYGVKEIIDSTNDIGDSFCQFYILDNGDGTETTYYFVDFKTTDDNGQISYKSVVEDKHAFVEIAAPLGYTLEHKLYEITRSAGVGQTQRNTVTDRPAVEFPMTGESGVLGIMLKGMTLMFISTLAIIVRTKRRKKGGYNS